MSECYPVSVIVPCWDEDSEDLKHTVMSAHDAGAGDIVVVDDGSANGVVLPVRATTARTVRQKHAGIAAALNTGQRRAKHDVCCWLSVGDTMYKDKLERQLPVHLKHKRPVFHDYYDPHRYRKLITSPDWEDRIWRDNQFSMSTAMFRRGFEFDESLTYCVDWAFALLLQYHLGWVYLPKVLGTSAEWPGGHSSRARASKALWQRKQMDRAQVCRRWTEQRQRTTSRRVK